MATPKAQAEPEPKAIVVQHFPTWRYHPDYEPILVNDEQELEELDGWYSNPSDFGLITCPSADQFKFRPKVKE